MAMDNNTKRVGPDPDLPAIRRRSTRLNCEEFETVNPEQKILTPDEKVFLLNVEKGDVAYVKKIVTALCKKKQLFDLNCVDPLGRNAIVIAIENENIEMIQFLLEAGIELKDSLLVAIREDYVDGVECLLRFEEDHHKPGTTYSWEAVDQVTANFTSDITPLILAAQRNNYEILKMLLDRGATIPMPHDVKCSCDECVEESSSDSLRFSLSRINAYKALASPSLIALSSKDPILTAFELSNELKRLSMVESQFREDFTSLRKQVQNLATGLIDHARTSYELEILLNHNPDGRPWKPGEFQTLERLKLAIEANQKKFVTHPSVQQLLAAIWYEGLPGFRRLHIVKQALTVFKQAVMFPAYSMAYIVAPNSKLGNFAKKPFVKFISNSASYMFFLFLLTLASQRVEYIAIDLIVTLIPGTEWLAEKKAIWQAHERGSLPTMIEMTVIMWVQALIVKEIKDVFKDGLMEYLSDMWNLADLMSYGAFLNWIGLRALSWFLVQREVWQGKAPDEIWIPREQWKSFDPHLLAEGMFGAGMISSFLKVIHIFSINPYLGPLQVSLGKMVIDIAKWLVLYVLVLFSFGCGLNQLLWYYADLEKQQCYSLPGGLPDFENYGDSCVMWRRFANLWETSQSLFWASFGLVELGDFELKGIKEFTRFWGLLMFGSYSVCNIIVLLNMLIAMMSNSYTNISERSDMEWKFARSKLWTSYFNQGHTVAPPLNLIPTPRGILRLLGCCCGKKNKAKEMEDELEEQRKADNRYYGVVRCLVRRYITDEQRKSQDFNITEDDINEVRQDIRTFRYELINILKMNDMKTPQVKESNIMGRKSKDLERMIQKGFQITKIEGVMENIFSASTGLSKNKDMFRKMAKAVMQKKEKQDWNAKVRQSSVKIDPIGKTETSLKKREESVKRSLLARGNTREDIERTLLELNTDQLVSYNPLLRDYTPITRLAYAKFKGKLQNIREPSTDRVPENDDNDTDEAVQIELPPQKTVVKIEDETKVEGQPPKKPDRVLTEEKPREAVKEVTANVAEEKKRPNNLGDTNAQAQNLATDTISKETPEQAVPTTFVKAEEEKQGHLPASSLTPKTVDVSENLDVAKSEPATPSREEERKTPTRELKSDLPSAVDTTRVGAEKQVASDKPDPKVRRGSTPRPKGDLKESKPAALVPEDRPKFDPRGKSVSTGKNIAGWI